MKEENSTITNGNELDEDIAKLKAIRSETRSAHMDQLEDIERQASSNRREIPMLGKLESGAEIVHRKCVS